ncbi:hypothetical protein UVI_02013070 [Ustilaginoidea virens]|uniref:YAG7-like dimerisation domain-containing protein n=1 Tax=Ustilaginoidea virens TaxID=1159556 RepID=A0A1B5KRJ3_USTVR|nr:hypothetical protein UVI_02013070 [Ustilaginoidea virens]
MAAPATQSAPKAPKKKLASAVGRDKSPAPSIGSGAAADSQDEGFDSPYIKELQNEHAGKSLEELVLSRVINADQKAQIQKKPALQAQLAQTEEQLAQYQKVHEQYRSRALADKAEWDKSLDKVKADAVAKALAGFQKSLQDKLLTLSQFLRLAAYRREEASDPESDENQAIEGVLFAIYAGDESAVSSMLKLVEGTDDKVLSVPGEQLQTSYSVVKTLAQGYKVASQNDDAQPVEAEADIGVADSAQAHARETEAPSETASAHSGQETPQVTSNGFANAGVAGDTANAAGDAQWDAENSLSASQEWVDVKVPQDPCENETVSNDTPAADANPQSWADEQPEASKSSTLADSNEGFHQVQRNKIRQDRDGNGNWRGRGRGEHRGRGGHRGDGRGRGRGRGSMPSRPRRQEEA